MTKRQRVSDVAGSPAVETGVLRLGSTARKTRTNLCTVPALNGAGVNAPGWSVASGPLGSASMQGSTFTGAVPVTGVTRTALATWVTAPSSIANSGISHGSSSAGTAPPSVNVAPSAPVTASVYARASVSDRTVAARLSWYNAIGTLISEDVGTTTAIGGTGWVRVSVSAVAPATAARVVMRILAVGGANWVVGSTMETTAMLIEAGVGPTPDVYFDGDITPAGAAKVAWAGSAGFSASTASYQANVLAAAPSAASDPSAFPPGMSAWRTTTALGYPAPGLLVVHSANIPVDAFSLGICYQQLFPDNDLTVADTMAPMTRTYSDQYGWNPWTGGGVAVYDEATLIEDITGRMYFTGAGVGVSQDAGDGTVTVNVPGTMGLVFYPDPTDASDIATYKKLRLVPSAAVESTVVVACTGTADVLVGSFASDAGTPGAVDFPAGTAFRNLYAATSAGTARFHLQVYKRDAAGVETLVRDEFSPSFTNTAVALQNWSATATAVGTLLATDRLVMKLYAQRVAGSASINVTTYFEGSTHTSSITTTIAAGAPIGTAGGDLAGTYPNPSIAANMRALFTAGSLRATDAKVGVDVYTGPAAPGTPADGDLWVSPGVASALTSVSVASTLFTAGNWYRIASTTGGDPAGTNNSAILPPPRASARFILDNGANGRNDRIEFSVSMAYGRLSNSSVRFIDVATYSTTGLAFTKIRLTYKATYDQWYVDVWCNSTITDTKPTRVTMIQDSDWEGAGFTLNQSFGATTPATPANAYLTAEYPVPSLTGVDPATSVEYNGTTGITNTASTAFVGIGSGAAGDFIAPQSGKVRITISGYLRTSVAGTYAHLSWQWMGGPAPLPTSGASATDSFSTQDTGYTKADYSHLETGLVPGATYTIRAAFASGIATSTASVASTRLIVTPVP